LKILAILQNQWFKDPDAVRAMYARRPEMRQELLRRFLFMGCLTGRRLRAAFGEETCRRIVWEEASPEIGGESRAAFRADPAHILAAVEAHRPEVVLAFGKIASDAVTGLGLGPGVLVLCGPHPAARRNPMPVLREMAARLSKGTEWC
jgi:hypothetical protein